MLSYYCFQDLRKAARELLVYLAICDLATSVTYIVSLSACAEVETQQDYAWNLTQALMGIYFPVAAFLWTNCIAFYLWGATYKKPFMQQTRALMRAFHAFAWGLPLVPVITIVAAAWDNWQAIPASKAVTGGWCWVEGIQWQLLGGKGFELLSFIILPIFNCLTYCQIRKTHSLHAQHGTLIAAGPAIRGRVQMVDDARQVWMQRRLLLIPAVFLLLRSWGTIRSFIVFACPECADRRKYPFMAWLHFLQAICDPAQGFANGTIFVLLSTPVRTRMTDCVCRAFGAQVSDHRARYKARLISQGTITTMNSRYQGSHANYSAQYTEYTATVSSPTQSLMGWKTRPSPA